MHHERTNEMAKTKSAWLEEAKELGLKLTPKDKIADIKVAIQEAQPKKHDKEQEAKPAEKKSTTAKAGKRSAKALKEEEAEAKRQERIEQERGEKVDPEEVAQKRGPVPVTRPLIERRSRRYQEVAKLVDAEKLYGLKEGIELAVKTSKLNFDASLELHLKLNVDPKQADQNVRGVLVLPNGTGKTVRVAVFASADAQDKAKAAGADIVGEEDFLELLKKEEIDFDILVSTPQMMAQLGRFAKLLGPKGLMPNPKSGTVTKDVAGAVKRLKAGQLEYRVDEQGIVHTAAGKVSFGTQKLLENAEALLESVKQAKPASVKGAFVDKVFLTTTMGPSIKLDVSTAFSDL